MKSLVISGNVCCHIVHMSCCHIVHMSCCYIVHMSCCHIVHMSCHLLHKNTKFQIHKITFTCPVTDVKIKIYRTTTVPIVLYGCQTWYLLLRNGRAHILWCLNAGYQGRYRDLSGRKLPETGGNCIFMWFMIRTPHQILYVWSIPGGWDEWVIWDVRVTREVLREF